MPIEPVRLIHVLIYAGFPRGSVPEPFESSGKPIQSVGPDLTYFMKHLVTFEPEIERLAC